MISHTMSTRNKTSAFQHGIILVGRSAPVVRSVGLYMSVEGLFNVPRMILLYLNVQLLLKVVLGWHWVFLFCEFCTSEFFCGASKNTFT